MANKKPRPGQPAAVITRTMTTTERSTTTETTRTTETTQSESPSPQEDHRTAAGPWFDPATFRGALVIAVLAGLIVALVLASS